MDILSRIEYVDALIKENGVFVKITKDGIKIKATKEYIKNINKMGDTV